jgi:hypothetical protein
LATAAERTVLSLEKSLSGVTRSSNWDDFGHVFRRHLLNELQRRALASSSR